MNPAASHLELREPARPRLAENERARRPNLDRLAARWQLALDAADAAVEAAAGVLPASERGSQVRALLAERQRVADTLARVAATIGERSPWLAPIRVTPPLLGLRLETRACLFDLDDVLTNSRVLHAWAWAEVFDELLLRNAVAAGWAFTPFDRIGDYDRYIAGRTRLEGIHLFLGSRGIQVREGRPGDSAAAESAYGLAARKAAALRRDLHGRGVTAVPGARGYLEAAGHAGLARVVLSASSSTDLMLELAGLDSLVDDAIDAAVVDSERLRPRPAPNTVLAACSHVGVAPAEAVIFTREPAAVVAAHLANVEAIAVATRGADELLAYGAARVVPSLAALLDRRLVAA